MASGFFSLSGSGSGWQGVQLRTADISCPEQCRETEDATHPASSPFRGHVLLNSSDENWLILFNLPQWRLSELCEADAQLYGLLLA